MFKNESERDRAPGKGAPDRGVTPLLPLRDIIVFPHMPAQLFVGRERSIAALDEAMNRSREVFLAAQKNAKTNDPTPEDIFVVGAIGLIKQLLRLPEERCGHRRGHRPPGCGATCRAIRTSSSSSTRSSTCGLERGGGGADALRASTLRCTSSQQEDCPRCDAGAGHRRAFALSDTIVATC